MEDLGSCDICGHKARNKEEVTLWFRYGCCKALVRKNGDYTNEVELCSPNRETGGYYDPGTKPNEFREDPDALHDLFCEKYKKKEKPKTDVDKGNNNNRN